MFIQKILLYTLIIFLSGCAITTPTITQKAPVKPDGLPGIYHRVEKGQTLWRISKMYNADMDDLVMINHIRDATNIETGQLIFIPRAQNQTSAQDNNPVSEDFIWPMRGRVVSTFGQISEGMVSRGINIQPYRKNEEVIASRSGRVVFCHPSFKNFGKIIVIDHGDGFSTVYAHNSEVYVKAGDTLSRGTVIAKLSPAKAQNKNIRLYFQIVKGHQPQNPFFYLPRS